MTLTLKLKSKQIKKSKAIITQLLAQGVAIRFLK